MNLRRCKDGIFSIIFNYFHVSEEVTHFACNGCILQKKLSSRTPDDAGEFNFKSNNPWVENRIFIYYLKIPNIIRLRNSIIILNNFCVCLLLFLMHCRHVPSTIIFNASMPIPVVHDRFGFRTPTHHFEQLLILTTVSTNFLKFHILDMWRKQFMKKKIFKSITPYNPLNLWY